ncbi:MAG: SiaB family protein kinase [Desulfobacterales bacterium]|nr:SiaB family protein kinase [Desulfobacterales bacterium]
MEIIPANSSKIQMYLESQGIIFYFTGPLSQDILRDIVKNLQIKREMLNADPSTLRRLITVIIELTQNIMYYSIDSTQFGKTGEKPGNKSGGKPSVGNGFLALGQRNNGYFVTCGNKVSKKQVPILRDKLSHLQKLTPDEIKKYYIEQLNRDPEDPDQIGGLGFIEMAKRTSKPIQFEFDPIDEDNQYISITGHIKRGK